MSDTTKASQGDWETHPLTQARFEDFADVINPNRRATHCWCLSHRLRTKDIEELGPSREEAMRRLSRRGSSPIATGCRSAGATSGRVTTSRA